MSKLYCKWKFMFCVLVLTLWEHPACAQSSSNLRDPQTTAQNVSTAVMARELATMKKRIEELEAQLQKASAPEQRAVGPTASVPVTAAVLGPPDTPDKELAAEPFALVDFTWLTGNSRTKESPLDTKIFTVELRVDVDYVHDLNHPKDNTISGFFKGRVSAA